MSSPKVKLGVAFDGEKEVKAAVSNINAQLKTLKSEAEKVKSAFEGQEKSEESLKATSKVLAQTLEVQRSKMKAMAEAVEKATAHEKELAERKEKLPGIIAEETRKLEEMKSSMDASSSEIKKQEEYVQKLENELKKLPQTMQSANTHTEQWKNSLNKTETELNKTERELNQTEAELKDYSNKADKAGDETKELGDSAEKSSTKISSMAVAWGTFVGNLALDALKSAAREIKDFAVSIAELGIDFDSSMSNVKALSGATDQELAKLTATAREAGKTTVFSAQESADALSYMALAGWDTKQMVAGLPSVLDLAAAAQMDLAEASDIVTDNVTAFGLSAKDSGHFADVMAYAMAHSNTDVAQLGEAYKNVASTAASMGISVEEVTSALMTMANAGVKGGEAGNGLNAIITRLATNTKGSADELKKYGVNIYDSEGKMSSLSDILIQTSKVWDGLTQKEQANLAKTIAGQNQYSKFQTVMAGLSDKAKQTGQSFQDYTEQLKNCDGAASDMSKTMNDNLAGDLKTLKSVTEDFKLTLYNMESGEMRNIVQRVTYDLIPAFEALVTGAEDASEQIGDAFDGLLDNIGEMGGDLVSSFFGEEAGDAVKEAFDVIGDSIKQIMPALKELGPTIGQIISTASEIAQAVLPLIVKLIEELAPFIQSIVTSIGKAVSAILPALTKIISGIIDLLGPLLKALEMINNVIGAVFDGIGYLINGFMWLISGCPKVAENFEEVRDSTEELNDTLSRSAKSFDNMLESQQRALSESSTEIENIESLKAALDDIVDANGKVKKGYEGRAQYIIDKLSEATGVEIECIDGTIKEYDKLKKSIEDVMAVKKAEALQNYYQSVLDTFEGGVDQLSYNLADAREQLEELETAMANTSQNTDEWKELNEQHEELISNIDKLTNQYETAHLAEARLYELEEAMAEGNTKQMGKMYEDREKFYFKDGQAYKATTDQKLKGAQENLRQEKDLLNKYKDSNDKTMKQVTETSAKEAEKEVKKLEQAKEAEVAAAQKSMQKIISETKFGSNTVIDLLNLMGVGGGAAYARGIDSQSGNVSSASSGLKNTAAASLEGGDVLASQQGDYFGQAYYTRIKSWLLQAAQDAGGWVGSIIKNIANAQESNSPSRKARKLGDDFGTGYALGIEDSMPKAVENATLGAEMTLKSVSDVSVTAIPSLGMMNLYNGMTGQNLSLLYAINGLRGDIKNANLGVNNYNIDGITYDDGSNISDAVQTLVHAAQIERRV